MLDRALAWGTAGWPVFPSYDKPITEWQKKATTDEEVIRGWDWEGARVCAVPGLAGCFVIDVDVKNDKNGEASLAALEKEHGFEAWEIPQQTTPSGGRHLFFRGRARTSVQRALGEGLDTRGGSAEGGLGFIYCYDDTPPCVCGDAASAPETLLKVLESSHNERSEETQTPRVELDQEANIHRATAYLRGAPTPDEGARNIEIFKLVCTLKDLGLSMAKVFELIESYPSVTGDPPLCEENEEEFNTTVRSAYKNGQLQPGIHAIDEGTRNAAAAGFNVSEPQESTQNKAGTSGRKRHSLWVERRDRPAPPWLVRGLLAQTSLVGLYGPGGSYKSFLALDCALAVASRSETWAGLGIASKGAPVVYVAGEGSADARIRAWEAKHGKSEAVGQNFLTYDGLDLTDEDQMGAFQEAVDKLTLDLWKRAPALVIFDTLARAAPGQDENSAKDMGLVVKAADAIKDYYQCCVVLVHHTPKSGHDWRGSTAVWNSLDTGLLVKRQGLNQAVLKVERQKDGIVGQGFSVALEELATGRERDGDMERSLVVKEIAPKMAKPQEEKAEAVANTVKMRDIAVSELRAQAAIKVIEATAPGWDIPYHTLVNQMMTTLGPGASRPEALAFVKSVVKKGEVQGEHPLAKYLFDIKGLCFRCLSGVRESGKEGDTPE